ncbi:unnamed protein product [Phytophthora fragariaefolia]|uniref:Unnamed protein product n=1 Tax=Phytophthora fragariaefolia TaxID=1490495 RepID=A0A9W7CN02_9STRA|nr:unnamed protein product [Phytophthora fragariaefolia]
MRICTLNGIMHQRTVPYSPQQNGLAERMISYHHGEGSDMLHYKGVTMEWWAEAVSTAVYLINRSTNMQHTTVTPWELGFKVKSTLEHLWVFGSHGYAHIDKPKRTKLEPKIIRCMFLGYAENVKRYRVFDLDTSKVKMVCSVKLDKCEVDGVYETQPVRNGTVVHVSEDAHDVVVPASVERQPAVTVPNRSCLRTIEWCFIHRWTVPDVLASECSFLKMERSPRRNESQKEVTDHPPSPKRAGIDVDGLIAEAVLAYAASIGNTMDIPTTHAQAMTSDEAAQWREAMDAELLSHEWGTVHGQWFHE